MRKIRTIAAMLLALLLLLPAGAPFDGASLSLTAKAAGTPAGIVSLSDCMTLPAAPAIGAEYAVLYDMRSGEVLYSKNAFSAAEPASITKTMTALLTVENSELNDTVTFSYNATHNYDRESSNIARTEGEEMNILDCLYGMLLASANEVAQGLAEHIGGNLTTFSAMMNRRARQLGCVNTHFSNPHGLHEEEHYTCPYDMALILAAAMEYPTLREIMGTERYEIPPTNKHTESTYVKMHHPLLTDQYDMYYSDAVAGKTGYTEDAMYTLVTYASHDDMDLICVIMKAESTEASGKDAIALFNYGFDNFHCRAVSGGEAEGTEDNPLSSNILGLAGSGTVYVTLPNGISLSSLDVSLEYNADAEDGVLAVRRYSYRGHTICEIPLSFTEREPLVTLTGTVSRPLTSRDRLRARYLGVPLIYWIVIGIVLLTLALFTLCLLFVISTLRRRRRREKQHSQSIARQLRDNQRN